MPYIGLEKSHFTSFHTNNLFCKTEANALNELERSRAKDAIPHQGVYRLIEICLARFLNA